MRVCEMADLPGGRSVAITHTRTTKSERFDEIRMHGESDLENELLEMVSQLFGRSNHLLMKFLERRTAGRNCIVWTHSQIRVLSLGILEVENAFFLANGSSGSGRWRNRSGRHCGRLVWSSFVTDNLWISEGETKWTACPSPATWNVWKALQRREKSWHIRIFFLCLPFSLSLFLFLFLSVLLHLFLSLCLSFCLSLSVSLSFGVSLSLSQSRSLSPSFSLCLSLFLSFSSLLVSVSLSVFLSLSQSLFLFFLSLSVSLFLSFSSPSLSFPLCLFLSLSVSLSISLSVCHSLSLSLFLSLSLPISMCSHNR